MGEIGEEANIFFETVVFDKLDAFRFAFAVADACQLDIEFSIFREIFLFKVIEGAQSIDKAFLFDKASDLNEFSCLRMLQKMK